MLINLSDVLTKEGREAEEEISLEMEVFESGEGKFPILEKSPVFFVFANTEPGKARVRGRVKLVLEGHCDRCLVDVPVELDLSFERVLVASEDVCTEDEEADDLGFMEGYQLDVEAFVYHEIICNWPAKILCKEDCRGICPICGQNLNAEDCGCDTFVPDPRMAVIQDIFDASKEV